MKFMKFQIARASAASAEAANCLNKDADGRYGLPWMYTEIF